MNNLIESGAIYKDFVIIQICFQNVHKLNHSNGYVRLITCSFSGKSLTILYFECPVLGH